MYKVLRRLITVILIIAILLAVGACFLTWILLKPEKTVYPILDGPEITSSDGIKLKAVQQADQDSHKWVILVHGYRSNHSMMNEFARIYKEKKYNTLQPDNSAHGSSGGNHIGMGYYEAIDILKWILYITEIDPDAEIVLHGISMGAAGLMILSDQTLLPENVKVIVEDSGYSSAMDYVLFKLKNTTGLRIRIIPEIMSWLTDRIAGYSLKEAAPLEHVVQSRVPILFIHGEKDSTVPVKDAYSLYEAAGCTKEIYICENAGHGESAFVDPAKYWDKVFSFIYENGENN